MSDLPVPLPGNDLVPDGWWRAVVVPWADEQVSATAVAGAAARLAGLIEAYRTLGHDTLELTKARRYVELRWGEMLGEVEPGERTDLEPSRAGEGFLSKDDRHRFRQLAGARSAVLELLEQAEDPDEITRAACTRLAKRKPASARDAAGMLGALLDDDEEDEDAGQLLERWSDQHSRRRKRIFELIDDAQRSLGQAGDGMTAHGISELLRSAEANLRVASNLAGELAFSFERAS